MAKGKVPLVIVFFGFILAGCNLTYYFDDPAVRACRNDAMNGLADSSSYGDVRVMVDLDDGATGVSIDHDYLTADGQHQRATNRCEFIYFNGFFHFRLPASDDAAVHQANTERWDYLMKSGLAIIIDHRTVLAPGRRDFATEACIRKLGGGGEFPLPRPHDFTITHETGKDGAFDISITSREGWTHPLLPQSGQCSVMAPADGTMQVTSKNVVR